MTITQMREKYGERVLNRAVTDIVIAGLDVVKKREDSARSAEIVNALVAKDIDASEWNDVRAIIKRML